MYVEHKKSPLSFYIRTIFQIWCCDPGKINNMFSYQLNPNFSIHSKSQQTFNLAWLMMLRYLFTKLDSDTTVNDLIHNMQMYLFSQVNCRGELWLAEMSGQSYYLSLFSLRGEKVQTVSYRISSHWLYCIVLCCVLHCIALYYILLPTYTDILHRHIEEVAIRTETDGCYCWHDKWFPWFQWNYG